MLVALQYLNKEMDAHFTSPNYDLINSNIFEGILFIVLFIEKFILSISLYAEPLAFESLNLNGIGPRSNSQ